MNLVMPMAGRGGRFAAIGCHDPKPLIDVRGRPMYSWAMDSLPLTMAERVIFICLDSHLVDQKLEADILARYGHLELEIVALANVSEGQACTVLEAQAYFDNSTPLIIYNADTYCRTRLGERLPKLERHVDGLLGVFRAPGEQWSFARVDDMGKVVETAEKRRISDWACTGLYHFSRGEDFAGYARAMIDAGERVNGEFYVAPVYNRMITDGKHIGLDVAEEVGVMGTPEDLDRFLSLPPDT